MHVRCLQAGGVEPRPQSAPQCSCLKVEKTSETCVNTCFIFFFFKKSEYDVVATE